MSVISDLTVFDGLGVLGACVVLGGYFLLQSGKLRGSDNRYAVVVMVGNLLLLTNLFQAVSLGSMIVQATFVVLSMYGIIRREMAKRKLRFSTADEGLLASLLPDMPRAHARRFLDLGTWSGVTPGTVLMRAGEPVTHLVYLDDAVAEVTVGDLLLARLTRGVVGELNALSASPSSATVTVTQPGRVFVVSGAALKAQMNRDGDFRHGLEAALNRELGRKLVQSNLQRAHDAPKTAT